MPLATRFARNPTILAAVVGGAALAALPGCQVKESDANLVAGKQQFVAKCGSCHILNRAGTKGTTGPNLDLAFKRDLIDGFERDTVRGVVRHQILYPRLGSAMPAKLATGRRADDIAAYVAQVVARSGKDTGLLATAVKVAGAGKPAVAKNGTLDIPADPNGQLAYITKLASAPPGELLIRSKNDSTVDHNIALEGGGVNEIGPVVQGGRTSQITVRLTPGSYTYYCTVQGHRAAGMLGKLTVKR